MLETPKMTFFNTHSDIDNEKSEFEKRKEEDSKRMRYEHNENIRYVNLKQASDKRKGRNRKIEKERSIIRRKKD